MNRLVRRESDVTEGHRNADAGQRRLSQLLILTKLHRDGACGGRDRRLDSLLVDALPQLEQATSWAEASDRNVAVAGGVCDRPGAGPERVFLGNLLKVGESAL